MIERRAVREIPLRLGFALLALLGLLIVLGFIGITTAQRWIEIRNEMAVKRCQQQMVAAGRAAEVCRHGR